MSAALRDELLGQGAAVVGTPSSPGYLGAEIAHLDRAVSIAVARRLNEDTLGILTRLQKRAVRHLKAQGYRTLALPPDSDRKKDTFVSKLYALFNHKMAATSAGIGWVGKNGLLISPEHGPRLSLATVLTDAPLRGGRAVRDRAAAGRARSAAITARRRRSPARSGRAATPFVELVRLGECRGHKAAKRQVAGKPNCGLCITVCPYGAERNARRVTELRMRTQRGPGEAAEPAEVRSVGPAASRQDSCTIP